MFVCGFDEDEMSEESVNNQVSTTADTDDELDVLIRNTPELAAAQDYEIDVRMLIDNANRSVSERIKRHQIALDTYQKLRNARLLCMI